MLVIPIGKKELGKVPRVYVITTLFVLTKHG